jgi:hypothetical protein
MLNRRPSRRSWAALLALLSLAIVASRATRSDTIVLKNGLIYRGVVDRDNTLLWVYDGLKRVVLRNTRVARIESDASLRNTEVFQIKQPLVVHAGEMPKEVVRVDASAPARWLSWNRRSTNSGRITSSSVA